MKRFAALYRELDRSTATLDKRAALVAYFQDAPAHDAAWALWLLSGGKLAASKARIANSRELRAWIVEASAQPEWLVEDCYHHVGDLAETLALLLDDPANAGEDLPLHIWIEQRLLPVAGADEPVRRAVVLQAWGALDFDQRLVFNKLLTGALRVGASQRLVQQALAQMSGIDIARIAQRMLGSWSPNASFLGELLTVETLPGDRQQPYPFFLASPLEPADAADPAGKLGALDDWLLEWKWDGIRLQLIRRNGEVALWSRGEERLDGRFPEIEEAAATLPHDCVIDGELLAWQSAHSAQAEQLQPQPPQAPQPPKHLDPLGRPMPFTALQKRIQRRKPGAKLLAEAPARVLAYDLLEAQGEDLRALPLEERRARLAAVLRALDDPRVMLSPSVQAADWAQAACLRDEARTRGVEGLMLKRRSSPYRVGRRRGDWWKWKIDPLTIDAVLLYAQSGHGRRSTLFTDYTFGLWDGDTLVPVAKAYSGLDDGEILALDRWIRAHTLERFGPVRAVRAEHVFELGFEAVNRSGRHKSGVAVRFPRILRWRQDKPAAEADRLDTLKALAQ